MSDSEHVHNFMRHSFAGSVHYQLLCILVLLINSDPDGIVPPAILSFSAFRLGLKIRVIASKGEYACALFDSGASKDEAPVRSGVQVLVDNPYDSVCVVREIFLHNYIQQVCSQVLHLACVFSDSCLDAFVFYDAGHIDALIHDFHFDAVEKRSTVFL